MVHTKDVKYFLNSKQWDKIWEQYADEWRVSYKQEERRAIRYKIWEEKYKPIFHLSYKETLDGYTFYLIGSKKHINWFLLQI